MLDTAVKTLLEIRASSEYLVISQRLVAEIDAIFSKAQTHYANVFENELVLHHARAKHLSDASAAAVSRILENLEGLTSEELKGFRGLCAGV